MEVTSLVFFRRQARITLRFRHYLYSSQVPELGRNLLKILPSLRDHRCANRHGLPFAEEVTDSELGHIFEHLMLEILSQRGVQTRGLTTWNWQRDPLGTFHLTISTGKKLLVKESLLIAQAIFTNALHGPVLRVTLPASEPGPQPALFVPADNGRKGRLMFATGTEETESS